MEDKLFTEEELAVAIECISRRIYRLEELGLTDSYCYVHLYNFRQKLKNAFTK